LATDKFLEAVGGSVGVFSVIVYIANLYLCIFEFIDIFQGH